MENELIKYDDDAVKKVLIDTVAKGANPSEYEMFKNFCISTGLNPFKKEVWFIKTNKGQIQMMTGINGFLAIANERPEYDGMEISEGDAYQLPLKKNNDGVESITIPEYVECRVYRKDRKYPSVARAYWREYAKELITSYGYLSIWAKMPRVMLAKCAKGMALREAFPQQLNGLYTVEEMPSEYSLKEEPQKQTIYYYDVDELLKTNDLEVVRAYLTRNHATLDEDKRLVRSLRKLEKLKDCPLEIVVQ